MGIFSVIAEIAEALEAKPVARKPLTPGFHKSPTTTLTRPTIEQPHRQKTTALQNKYNPSSTKYNSTSTKIDAIVREQQLAESKAGGSLFDYLRSKLGF